MIKLGNKLLAPLVAMAGISLPMPAQAHATCDRFASLTWTNATVDGRADISCTGGHTFYETTVCVQYRLSSSAPWNTPGDGCNTTTYSSTAGRYEHSATVSTSTCPLGQTVLFTAEWRAVGTFVANGHGPDTKESIVFRLVSVCAL